MTVDCFACSVGVFVGLCVSFCVCVFRRVRFVCVFVHFCAFLCILFAVSVGFRVFVRVSSLSMYGLFSLQVAWDLEGSCLQSDLLGPGNAQSAEVRDRGPLTLGQKSVPFRPKNISAAQTE